MAERLVADAVWVTRATRVHPDVRQGSSVRGAIDIVALVMELAQLRGIDSTDHEAYRGALLDAMLMALSGRIQLDEVADTTPEELLRWIWEQLLLTRAAPSAPG
jgi:MoxR-like ATPase